MSVIAAIVDPPGALQDSVARWVAEWYDVEGFGNAREFLSRHANHPYDIVLAGINANPNGTRDLFRTLENFDRPPVRVWFAGGQEKPVDAPDLPGVRLTGTAADRHRLETALKEAICRYPAPERLQRPNAEATPLASSRAMRECLAYARRIAGFGDPVLITGETGAGKDVLARYLHHQRRRQNGPLQIVNCAAVNTSLFESEFFGAARGAYTGATVSREGHFQQAGNGTLVLDEITEVAPAFQAKLLRAIENQEIFPVGSQKMVRTNVRIIALSNRPVAQLVEQGKFRKDLYYRISKYRIDLPPLRRRPADIVALARDYVRRSWFGVLPEWEKRIDAGFYHRLAQQPLPGNVRELHNMIAMALSLKLDMDPYLRADDIPGCGKASPATAGGYFSPENENLKNFLRRMERQRIGEIMAVNRNNITRAARDLGISRQNLQQRLRRLSRREADTAPAD